MSASERRQVDFLRAVIRTGSQTTAAHAIGVSRQHLKNELTSLYARLGVSGMPAAVYVLWLRDLWGEA